MDKTALQELMDSWELNLRAQRKSPNTITSYLSGVRFYISFCEERGIACDLDKSSVNAYVIDQIEKTSAITAHTRLAGLKRFSKWLAAEDEIPVDKLASVKPPTLDIREIPELTDDECRALINACKGKTFLHRRDEAIVRFMLETMARIGEVVQMKVTDVDVKSGIAWIHKGKGRKERRVPFGPQTASAIDRYLRERRKNPQASSDQLWIGDGTRSLGYPGLHLTLKKRAESAGIKHFHPHMLRHTGAGRWLSADGSEGGLMAVAGWSRRDMIDRYTKATSVKRAIDESRTLNLGDL